MRDLTRMARLIGLLACMAVHPSFVAAQNWPARALTLVVPAAPGGGSDFTGRLLAQHLTEALGQSVVVENVPGGGNTIGHTAVAKSAPDGYRLLLSDSSLTLFPTLYPSLSFDPAVDLQTISVLIEVPFAIAISEKLKVRNLAEFVELARSQPGKLNFGSGGTGTPNHLAGEIFQKLTGTSFLHVPYKGGGPMMAALLGGQVDVIFATTTTGGLASQQQAGKLRILAVSGSRRSPSLPEVPSASEAGFRDFTFTAWFGLSLPRGTPQPVLTRLGDEARAFLAKPDTQKKMSDFGASILGTSQAEARSRIERDTKEVSAIVLRLGIKP